MSALLPLIPPDAVVPVPGRSTTRALLLGTVVGAGLGLAGVFVGRALAGPLIRSSMQAMPDRGWIVALLLLGAWFLSTLVHELGHLLGGALNGFRFQLLVVGPLRIARDALTDRVTVGFNRQLQLAGGLAACVPRSDDRLIPRLQWMVLGGPLASIALAIVGFVAWRLDPAAVWSGFALITAFVAFVTGLATLVPMQNGNFLSDGKRYLQLRGNDARAHRDAAMLLHTVRDRAGVAIADEPARAIAPMLEPADGSMFELLGRITAYAWLLEQQAVNEARAHLARAAAIAPGLPFHLEAGVALDQAYCAARYDGDPAAARALLARHARALPLMPATERLRADAAVAVAEHDATTARRLISEARAQLAGSPMGRTGAGKWTAGRLRELEALVEAGNSEPRNPNPEPRN